MDKPPFKTCSRKHCNALAPVLPILRIPAIGGDKANALTLPLVFPLCAGCARKIHVGEFTNRKAPFRSKVIQFCRTIGDARPDFGKAWLEFKTGE